MRLPLRAAQFASNDRERFDATDRDKPSLKTTEVGLAVSFTRRHDGVPAQ